MACGIAVARKAGNSETAAGGGPTGRSSGNNGVAIMANALACTRSNEQHLPEPSMLQEGLPNAISTEQHLSRSEPSMQQESVPNALSAEYHLPQAVTVASPAAEPAPAAPRSPLARAASEASLARWAGRRSEARHWGFGGAAERSGLGSASRLKPQPKPRARLSRQQLRCARHKLLLRPMLPLMAWRMGACGTAERGRGSRLWCGGGGCPGPR